MIFEVDHSVKSGTLLGTALTILGTINSGDVVKTTILAGIGAVVSFLVSSFLKWRFGSLARRQDSLGYGQDAHNNRQDAHDSAHDN